MNSKKIIIGVVIVALLAVAGYFVWKSYFPKPAAPTQEAPQSLGAQIYENIQNPIENKVPETNPFKAETNPFTNAYKNPFGQ
ncbi:MAG: hypothetical protein D4Q79_02160 [Spirochaetia bacterium]|nr:MAG: hypothetical protein D4Q79_02160 [Spirochaetia bacterium]